MSVADSAKPYRWGASRALIITVAIYIVSQLAAGIALYIYSAANHWTAAQTTNWLANSVVAQFSLILLVEAATLGLLYLFLRRYKVNFRDIGLKAPRWRDVGYALGGFLVYFPLNLVSLFVLRLLVHLNIDQKQQLGFKDAGGDMLWLVFISLVILPPLIEEILVRGFLYGSLKAHWPKLRAVLVTSLLFAAAHLQIGSGASLVWVAAVDTFILSLVLIYLRDKTGGLAASIMLHMLKNGLAFLALFVLHLS